MNKLKPATLQLPSRQAFAKAAIQSGATKKIAYQEYRRLRRQESYKNDLYTVSIDRDTENTLNIKGGMFCLTVRRNDRDQHIPFRHAQEIKNQIVGLENEMIELYPAESRLVDTANQYWYYGFNSPEIRFPFGMQRRAVTDNPNFMNAKQTPRDK